jgi:hypothetical protein
VVLVVLAIVGFAAAVAAGGLWAENS